MTTLNEKELVEALNVLREAKKKEPYRELEYCVECHQATFPGCQCWNDE